MTTYIPGEYATLVSDDGVVLASADRLAEVAALGDRGLDALTVVEVLSRGALRDLPDFAAVRLDGATVTVLVRGGFEVRVDGVTADGASASTWNEASVPVVVGSVIALGPVGTTPTGEALPLAGGVVRSACVIWTPQVSADAVAAPPAALPDEFTAVRPPPGALAPVRPAPIGPPPVLPTAVSPVLPPAPQTPPAPPVVPVPQPRDDLSTDHDGHTITAAQLQAMRDGRVSSGASPHVPPPAAPVRPRVAIGLSTGRVVPVRRRVLIGRSPRVQQVGGSANLPALVTVDDPYVSGTHLEISTDGTRITATDTSTNGTLLARRGRAPIPLDPGVATEVSIGDVLTLSKGLTATVIPAPEAQP